MGRLRFLSKVEQVAAYLREELMRGKWDHEISGREELAMDLGVNAKTVELALQQLEHEGVLIPQGAGRKRRIAALETAKTLLKIHILLYEKQDCAQLNHVVLMHRLAEAGHNATITSKSLSDLDMNLNRVVNYVESIKSDAWIIAAGPRDILEWFAQQPVPVYAEFGRCSDIPISSVRIDKVPAMRIAMKKLVEMGHRKIVMLTRTERRKPNPGLYERMFLQELASHGIATGPYHLPDWENNIDDFHRCLHSLFGKSPPTALFIDEPSHFCAAHLFLSRRGLVVPKDVSMICHDPDTVFSWCDPMVSHISWDPKPVASCVLKWANRVAAGKHEIKRSLIRGKLIEGGTIGPAPNP